MANLMTNVQHLGRSLMLPIAVLPVAAILLRLGQGDLLDIPFIAESGAAIFANLGMLFAVGIAVGFAKNNHGAAGLAGIVCYLVAYNGSQVLVDVPTEAIAGLSEDAVGLAKAAFKEKQISKLNVPIGILAGLLSGFLYNRHHNIKVPEFLAFFGGRRFVPIAAGFAGIFLAAFFGYGMPFIATGLDALSQGIVESGGFGLFIYGVFNRLLIVTGLHHILNNVAWFIIGDYNGATGDLNRFFAGDKTAGAFMAGYFPVMMFGLPAACLAMYRSAKKSRRKEVGGMYVSLGLTSFLTGVTEPIEFTFMFLAPVLYVIHAILTGISMALMDFLNVKLGFGFSAGLFDYVLNFKLGTNSWLLLPVGLIYGLLYYGIFRFFIVRFDLKVPGRDEVVSGFADSAVSDDEHGKAVAFIYALGGSENLKTVSACTTRLRLDVLDNTVIDESALKGLGARGVVRPSSTTLQVVVGPIADQVSDEIKQALAAGLGKEGIIKGSHGSAKEKISTSQKVIKNIFDVSTMAALARALGGVSNITGLSTVPSRLVLELKDASLIDKEQLLANGVRGVAQYDEGNIHLLLGPNAEQASKQLAIMANL